MQAWLCKFSSRAKGYKPCASKHFTSLCMRDASTRCSSIKSWSKGRGCTSGPPLQSSSNKLHSEDSMSTFSKSMCEWFRSAMRLNRSFDGLYICYCGFGRKNKLYLHNFRSIKSHTRHSCLAFQEQKKSSECKIAPGLLTSRVLQLTWHSSPFL